MTGSSLLLPCSSIGLESDLELLSRTERHHPARRDRNLLAGLGVTPRTLVFLAQIEIAETRQLHLLPFLECVAHHLVEGVDEFLGLTLVQADVQEQTRSHLSFGQRHATPEVVPSTHVPGRPPYSQPRCPRPGPKECGNCPAKSSQ